MKNILTAKIVIRGIRPLLWHHFGPDAIPVDGKREKTGVAGNDPEEWTRTVLMTADRQLYLEPTYFFGMLRDAAKFTRKGKGSIQSAVAATLQVCDLQIFLDRFVPEKPETNATLPVYLDVRSVRNPTTKARNVRYRVAASPGWEVSFSVQWDKTIVSRGEMEAVLRATLARWSDLAAAGALASDALKPSALKFRTMPKKRPPKDVWQALRLMVWERDGGKCVRCRVSVAADKFHCDHIHSGKLANNSLKNLRTLCRRCHVLRADHRHRGMIARALADGLIPASWRELVWDD